MIDVKPEIRNLLIANTQLTTLLGGDNVFAVFAPSGAVFPYVTIQELNNDGIEYADNDPTRVRIDVQVDVWSASDYTDIVNLVDGILTTAQPRYVRDHSADLVQVEPMALHKALRYWTAKELSSFADNDPYVNQSWPG